MQRNCISGDAAEWGSAHADEFESWADFQDKFKNKYWSASTQEKVMIELADPEYYNNSWGSIKKYLEWHFTRSKLLDTPLDEMQLARLLIRRLPYHVQ